MLRLRHLKVKGPGAAETRGRTRLSSRMRSASSHQQRMQARRVRSQGRARGGSVTECPPGILRPWVPPPGEKEGGREGRRRKGGEIKRNVTPADARELSTEG